MKIVDSFHRFEDRVEDWLAVPGNTGYIRRALDRASEFFFCALGVFVTVLVADAILRAIDVLN